MSKTTHIIYISYEPFIDKYAKDFYFDIAIQNGFKIEYWNLLPVYSKKLNDNELTFKNFEKRFYSYKKIEDEIKKYKLHSLFVFKINYYGRVYSLFRIFSKHTCKTAFFARGALPFPLQSQPVQKKILVKFKAFKDFQFLKKAISNQFAGIARKIGLIKPFNYVFYAGSESLPVIGYGYKYGLEKSKLIAVNSFDYDKYLEIKNDTNSLIDKPYCVFLDVYLPFHPDFDLLNLPKVNADAYYSSLNNFFDYVEDNFKIKVVIAAHPKSNYTNSKTFKDRLILKNKTAELIKDSCFVIMHHSTSVSFAVLFKKPIIFIYTNDIKTVYEHNQYPLILHFAKVLTATCLNIDESFTDGFKILSVDENLYDEYKYKFLTNPESENNLSENIVGDFFKKLRLTATDIEY